MNRYRIQFAALIAIAMLAGGCRHGVRRYVTPTIDPQFASLTKEQAFAKAEDFYNHKKWQRARSFYQHVYETSPNDPLGRRSLLRIADTYYQQNDPINLVEAQYKYRDFINRYPGSDRDLTDQPHERSDQQKTREAVEKFNDMIHTFPNSPLRGDAEKRLQDALDRLAKHEHIVAKYYLKRRSFDAGVRRLNFLIDTFPNYTNRVGAFYDIANALEYLGRKGEARLYYERVVSEFPKSDYAGRAKRKLDSIKA